MLNSSAKQFDARWLAGLSTLVSLGAFAHSSGFSAPALILLVLAIIALVAGERLDLSLRGFGLVTVVVLGVFFSLGLQPAEGHKFFEPALRSAFTGGLAAATLSIVLLVRRCPGAQVYLRVAAALGLMMAAGVVREPLPYAYYMTAQFAVVLIYLRLSTSSQLRALSPASLVAGLLVGLLATAMAMTLAWSETQLVQVFELMQGSGSTNFSARSDFSWARSRQASRRVVARYFGEQPPIHMVGMRYLTYGNQRWTVAQGKSDLKPLENPPAAMQGQVFTLGIPTDSYQVARVELTSNATTLLNPAPTRAVSARIQGLQLGPQGTIYLQAGQFFGGEYWLGLAGGQSSQSLSAYPTPSELVEQCLQLPEDCAPEVYELAQRMVDPNNPLVSVRDVEEYLRENFTYGFGHPFPAGQDPIGIFLRDRPPAHCEIFATSMLLILRAGGVPTRYVNGFLMAEKSRLGDYYVARDRDAHAWVEAYVEGHGWMTADPTPPAALESPSVPYWREVLEWLTGVLGRLWRTLTGNPLNFISTYPLVFLAGFAILVWGLRRIPWSKLGRAAGPPEKSVPTEVLEMQALFHRCRQVMLAAGHTHDKSLTPVEWAATLPPGQARQFLERYSEIRYSQVLPEPEQLEELKNLCPSEVAAS